MKINPLGIQSYQQINQRENSLSKQVDKNDKAKENIDSVSITRQDEAALSKLAVKISSGSYADFLSPEEKNALDILFSRFKGDTRFGENFVNEKMDMSSKTLGSIVDIKV